MMRTSCTAQMFFTASTEKGPL